MIAVVGGGITGLAVGRELARNGSEFVVLEASGRTGGVIRSQEVDGHLLDWGPQRARLTRGVVDLIDDLGLQDQVVTAPEGLGLFVYRKGKLRRVPFSARGFVTSDIVSLPAKLRMMLEPFTRGARGDESVAGLFTRKFGREFYENIVGPLYGGLYASDPAEMIVELSLGHVLREFDVGRSLVLTFLGRGGSVSPPPACSFARGMQTLPDALAASLGDRVRRNEPVRGLSRTAAGWRLETETGAFDCEAVILTAPAPVTARILAPVAPDAAERIATLQYNPLGVVHLHAETELEGLGFQVSLGERRALRGVTYNDSLFGRANVYTAYLGGATHPEVVDLDDAQLGTLAVDEFRRCTGYDAGVVSVTRERMPAWDRSWKALAGMELPAGIHLAANWETRPGIPGRLARARTVLDEILGRAPVRR
ncbi:MAG: protoporphyrinogen oxidase [Gemmatimonadota bacterium]|nr:protoporphyrinogen oxidase [Gemmatimonadota bacterium]